MGKSVFSDHPLVINKSQILVLEEIARILSPGFLEVSFLSLDADLPNQSNYQRGLCLFGFGENSLVDPSNRLALTNCPQNNT